MTDMETKDLMYGIGLLLTFGASIASLVISIKNRKNALREHLYKEQMAFFMKFTSEFSDVGNLIDDIAEEQMFSKKQDDELEVLQNNIHRLLDIHDFIVPDEIYSSINDVIHKLGDLHSLAIRSNGKIKDEDVDLYFNSYFNMVEDIKLFAGVDELSEENKSLYQKRRREKSK